MVWVLLLISDVSTAIQIKASITCGLAVETTSSVNGGVKLSNYGGIKLTTYLKNLLHVWTFFPSSS